MYFLRLFSWRFSIKDFRSFAHFLWDCLYFMAQRYWFRFSH